MLPFLICILHLTYWITQVSFLRVDRVKKIGIIIYASFILAEKFFWHLIDYGLNARTASEINEQIRKRRLKQKT